jgi:hypothetical protein
LIQALAEGRDGGGDRTRQGLAVEKDAVAVVPGLSEPQADAAARRPVDLAVSRAGSSVRARNISAILLFI